MRKFLIFSFSLLSFLLWSMFAGAEGQRKALLIGINDYARSTIPDLRGAVNDVHMLAQVLNKRMNFPEGSIVQLTDQQATRDNILNTLSKFINGVNENDIVYIHFSGHGSQVADMNGDEQDGHDETFLPYDARQAGIADITDDELDGLLVKLRSDNALVVFDSCHSGTVTRSVLPEGMSAREVPRDDRPDIAEIYSGAPLARVVVPVDKLGHVLMTSAPAEQQALDGPIGDSQEFYGIFSFALAKALDEHGPDATSEEIHKSVKKTLAAMQKRFGFQAPEPQLEVHPDKLKRAVF
jgi:Caspase domain